MIPAALNLNLMKTSIAIFLLLLAGIMQSAICDTISSDEAATLNRYAPSNLSNIREAMLKGDQAAELSEFIKLTDQIDANLSSLAGGQLNNNQRHDLRVLCRASWVVGIEIYEALPDNQDKAKFLTYWNDCLSRKSTPLQIVALGDKMDRSLLTPEFWSLLEMTNDPPTLDAFAYLVWKQGNDEDVNRLKQKIGQLKDNKDKDILWNGISYREWRVNGSPPPGPAMGAPSPYKPR